MLNITPMHVTLVSPKIDVDFKIIIEFMIDHY
jgi:hypothetical protein